MIARINKGTNEPEYWADEGMPPHHKIAYLCVSCRTNERGELCPFCKGLVNCSTSPCNGRHVPGKEIQVKAYEFIPEELYPVRSELGKDEKEEGQQDADE
jgi:hypothetical protein